MRFKLISSLLIVLLFSLNFFSLCSAHENQIVAADIHFIMQPCQAHQCDYSIDDHACSENVCHHEICNDESTTGYFRTVQRDQIVFLTIPNTLVCEHLFIIPDQIEFIPELDFHVPLPQRKTILRI
jgi:hypothetical protein